MVQHGWGGEGVKEGEGVNGVKGEVVRGEGGGERTYMYKDSIHGGSHLVASWSLIASLSHYRIHVNDCHTN